MIVHFSCYSFVNKTVVLIDSSIFEAGPLLPVWPSYRTRQCDGAFGFPPVSLGPVNTAYSELPRPGPASHPRQ